MPTSEHYDFRHRPRPTSGPWIKQAASDFWDWLKNPEVNLIVKILGAIVGIVAICITGPWAIALGIIAGVIEIVMMIRDYFTDKENEALESEVECNCDAA